MEAESANNNLLLGMAPRFFPAVGPILLISMGYIDPGKWSAFVDVGAHFGKDLVWLLFVFSCIAILCQYVAACISVATEKNLAQICREEYCKPTCMVLAFQAEASIIILDLTMILGIAHGLNMLLGLNLSTCLLFTAIDAVLFPLFSTLYEKRNGALIFVCTAGIILSYYVFGVLLSQPEIPSVSNGLLTSLNGEYVLALMSLLGANIMPHNFYVHSSFIQQQKGPSHASKRALFNDHFFAILCVFSGIYLVNYVLMSSAASVFNSAGLVVLTFQDMLSLLDQVLRTPIALFILFVVMFISSHITTLTWNVGGQVVLHELLGVEVPVLIHRAAIRVLVIVLSLYSTWNSGEEQIYQLLVFTQVMMAMLLPSSVIPLFRIASSRSIMGVYKISQFAEFLALTTLLGMLGLNIIFLVEMLFGPSEWVGELWWNMESGVSIQYAIVLIAAFSSLVFMLLLATTPLKSATVRVDIQKWNWDLQGIAPKPECYAEDKIDPSEHKYQEENIDASEHKYQEEKIDASEHRYLEEELVIEEKAVEKSEGTHSDNSVVDYDFDFPEEIKNSDQVLNLPLIDEEDQTSQRSLTCQPEVTSTAEFVPEGIVDKEVAAVVLPKEDGLKEPKSVVPDTKSVEVELDSQVEKDEDQGYIWEPEESYPEVSAPTSTSEGPRSFRSLKTDESSAGPASLSRLSGLGRAARRQLAQILDDFWGQLYDFHGNPTKEAKGKQWDILFGLDPKLLTSSLRMNPMITSSGYFPPVAERGAALPYDSPKQQRMLPSYGFQTGSSPWSTEVPYMDGYMQNSPYSVQDSAERRYSSLRLPPSSESWDYQPATVHGYKLSSYLSRINADRSSESLNNLVDSSAPKSPSFVPAAYRDPLPYALGQNPLSRVNTINTPSMHNPVVSTAGRLQAEKPYCDPRSYGPGENLDSPTSTKKYHSLPDISGLAVPRRDSHLPDRSSKWNGPPGFGPSVSKQVNERSLYSNAGSRVGAPSAYDELSSSIMYRDPFPMQPTMNSSTASLWSKQPFEQLFGVAGKYNGLGDEMTSRPSLALSRSASRVDSETALLKYFRYCIMKLLKLEGCEWLFKQNGGIDEDLIDRVAASEKFQSEKFQNSAEIRDSNQTGYTGDSQFLSSDRKYSSATKNQDTDLDKVPYCGEGCVWQMDLIVSFGVWCIHRILELSLMESRPELWGKYTYVLNRLQGILDPAFSKPRTPLSPCFCLHVPVTIRKPSPPAPNGMLPPTAKPGKGKCTTASTVLEIIKDVEIAVSCRKGRTGTAAGDVAFPKGKENLASVLKRYKRRLSNKPVGNHEAGSGRKVPAATPYA